MMGEGGAAFLLKSITISTIFRALSARLLQLHQFCSRSISLLYADSAGEAQQGDVVCKLQELDRRLEGGAAVSVQGKQGVRQDAALRGASAGGPGAGNALPQLHPLRPVGQEVGNPLTGRDRHLQQGVGKHRGQLVGTVLQG